MIAKNALNAREKQQIVNPSIFSKKKGLEGWEESPLKAKKNLKRIIIKSEKK